MCTIAGRVSKLYQAYLYPLKMKNIITHFFITAQYAYLISSAV